MELLEKINTVNLVIIAVVILAAVVIIVRTIKELTLKFGDKSISFSGSRAQNEVVKVVTEYADFKYKIKDEQADGITDLHEQAKRTVSLALDQYIKRLTSDYITYMKSGNKENFSLTINIFSLLIRLLYNKLFKFVMEIYERNHLKDRSDSELNELAELDYQRLSDIFKEFMQINWLEIMGDYSDLRAVCVKEEEFVKNLVLETLLQFRNLSRLKYELINTINDIDCHVRAQVQKTGKLPINAISILSDLYIPGTGLNQNSVEKWLCESK